MADLQRVSIIHAPYERNRFERPDGYDLLVHETAPTPRPFPIYRIGLDFAPGLLTHQQISYIRSTAQRRTPAVLELTSVLDRNQAPLHPVDALCQRYMSPVWPIVPRNWTGGALDWSGQIYVDNAPYLGTPSVDWRYGVVTFAPGDVGPNSVVTIRFRHYCLALIDTDSPTVWHEFDESGTLSLGLIVDPAWLTTTSYTVPQPL